MAFDSVIVLFVLQRSGGGERTVKKLRLSKALTIPEGTTVSDACRRMAARRVDAVLLTDANALLSGIVTDKVRKKNTIRSALFSRLCLELGFFLGENIS